MPQFLTKPANVLSIMLLVIVVGIVFYASATTMVNRKAKSMPTAAQIREALSLAGLSAKPLAAAGAQESQVSVLVGNARTYLTEDGGRFHSALASYRRSSVQVQRLERRVRSGVAPAEELGALGSARASLASAASAKQTAIANLFAAATANLSVIAVESLSTIRANRGREVPVQYAVVTRTEEQWRALRDALANVRISDRLRDDADSACQQLVLDANAENAVVAATNALGNLATVTGAWNSAVGQ